MNPAPTSPPVDPAKLAELQELFCDDGELAELFQEFWEELPDRLEGIRNGIQGKALEQIHQAAHALKGSSANLGAEGVRSAAAHLEDQARAGTLEDAPGLLERLEGELGRLEAWLRQEGLLA